MKSEHIRGTCMFMCPEKERKLRERERLLHKFECEDLPTTNVDHVERTFRAMNLNKQSSSGSESYGGSYSSQQKGRHFQKPKELPKADIHKTVKSFARSAAGQDKTTPADLRPPQILEQTVNYLCTNTKILNNNDETYNFIYDFVFDRLRAVRQDLVIQRITDESAIRILQSIVAFHVYSAYRLRGESLATFDPHINEKHLLDCLKSLTALYDSNQYSCITRSTFEALYVLVAPNSFQVLSRSLYLQPVLNSRELNCAIQMSISLQLKNFSRYFRLWKTLPPLLALSVVQCIREVRSNAYTAMTAAYGIKTCMVPIAFLRTTLLYPGASTVSSDLKKMSVEVLNTGDQQLFARFDKSKAEHAKIQMNNLSYEFDDKLLSGMTCTQLISSYLS